VTDMQIEQVVLKLIDQTPWGIRLGHGSFLTMEFGKPEDSRSGRFAHGEWHLWLYMCSWRIETQKQVLAGSQDHRDAIETALREVQFGSIRSINVAMPSHDLAIEFDSKAKLLVFSTSSTREQEQWMLFAPDGNCLTVFGNGTFEYTPRDQPRPGS
jgi:hypothetical protein